MRPGVVGYIPSDPAEITPMLARSIRELGYTGVTVRVADPLDAREAPLRDAGTILRDAGVEVVQCNPQYEMLVDPIDARRELGIRQLRAAARCSHLLGAHTIYVRPGSVSPAGPWKPHPENTRLRTIERLLASLRAVAPAGEDVGIPFALEGADCSPLDTPERIRDVLEAVGSPAMRFNADPVNLVGSLEDLYDNAALTNRLFDLCERWIVAAHVKDITYIESLTVHLEEVPLGEGIFDQATFARRFEDACPDGYFMLEHLPDAAYPRAKANLDGVLAATGIAWRI